jgi:triosephosphate isomerase
MQSLIAGNWKMNGLRAEAVALARAIRAGAPGLPCDLMLCPPFTALAAVADTLAGSVVALGGQDCHADASGAFTGDISAPMLADLGCAAVILGHSERRQGHGETSLQVRAKARAAAASGLMPILCVGETKAERDAGAAQALVCAQVAETVPDAFAGVLAYEPIWAIGTGVTATEADIASMHAAIRSALIGRLGEAGRGIRILYGGSVKPDNAASLLAVAEVGGALVGGASLTAADFLAIARAAPAAPVAPVAPAAPAAPVAPAASAAPAG